MNLQEKLLNIQANLKAPKSQYNNFGKYSYRNCEDILEAVKPLLAENKLALTISDEIVLIGDRYYVKAVASVIDAETCDKESVSAFAREEENKKGMDASQLTGSTSSYARKYALNGLFCIDDTKDSDTPNGDTGAEGKTNNLTQAQLKRLYAIANSKGKDKKTVEAEIKKVFNKKPSELTKAEYDRVCGGYENLK
ncbi:ERF family protein [Hathewaya massiliensis]|uniref:ERF family protein n=1 Tax=Hathewaya massiliensis TaxID=1964382 RepID=UPI00115B94EA|nr:ERF family protein [Hathewaya massiliensis]